MHQEDFEKVDVDSYMNKFMSHKNSVSSIHNQTCNSQSKRSCSDHVQTQSVQIT